MTGGILVEAHFLTALQLCDAAIMYSDFYGSVLDLSNCLDEFKQYFLAQGGIGFMWHGKHRYAKDVVHCSKIFLY